MLENKVGKVEHSLRSAQAEHEACVQTISLAQERLGVPFPRRSELEAAKERVVEINERIKEQQEKDQRGPSADQQADDHERVTVPPAEVPPGRRFEHTMLSPPPSGRTGPSY